MALEFESMLPAGKFGDTCETPILDLRTLCPDQVLAAIPRFLGRWEDGQTMKMILDDNWEITTSSDDCTPSVASAETITCSVLLPDQELVSVGFEDMLYRDTLQRFCDAKGIVRFPTLFRADGSFDTGQPLSEPFLMYLLSELKRPFMKHLRYCAWNGDNSNRHQFDGILTQIDAGPTPVSGAGACDMYEVVSFNWSTLTATGGSTATAPSAVIDAGQDSQTIHGETFTGLAGLNFVEVLRLWLERLIDHDLAEYVSNDLNDPNMGFEMELWVGKGQTACIAELAACMQPCDGCVDPMSDPQIRARAAEFRKNRVIWLYPYDNIPIVMRQSPELSDRVIFRPSRINGRPTLAWVFRNQNAELEILNGELPWYGSQVGSVDASPIYPDDEVMSEVEMFEMNAFSLHVERTGNCIDVFMNCDAGMLMFSPHLWLDFTYVNCDGLTPQECHDGMSIALTAGEDCQDGSGAGELDLTIADLETSHPNYVTAGDTWQVSFANGGVLIGTVVSYTTATDVLVLDTGLAAVDCTTYGGITAITPLADNA
jgi:hypothetical protein